MEKKLKALFDFQKFEHNEKLAALIDSADAGCKLELSDEQLEKVAAAGDVDELNVKIITEDIK